MYVLYVGIFKLNPKHWEDCGIKAEADGLDLNYSWILIAQIWQALGWQEDLPLGWNQKGVIAERSKI